MKSLGQRIRDFAYWRTRRVRGFAYWRMRRVTSFTHYWTQELVFNGLGFWANRRHARVGPMAIDPQVTYPCYMPLDEYVDVERLKSLDGFLQERVRWHLQHGKLKPFHTGRLKRRLLSRARPGSQVIYLNESKRPFDYLDLDDPDLWKLSEQAADFGPLMEFIGTLPFVHTGRMIIMCDDAGSAVTAHRDHNSTDTCHEFIWFRTNLDKPFWVQDARAEQEKCYVRSHAAWFDTVNQYHGADATDRLSISVRVDGHFADDFRARIPQPATNRASTPALWASLSGG